MADHPSDSPIGDCPVNLGLARTALFRRVQARMFGASNEGVVRMGRYIIDGQLGAGGMGIVLSAVDPDLGRRVAIKVLRGEYDEPQRERLRREAQMLAKLSHPNVVHVYEVGTCGDQLFVAMEFVEGRSLRGWLGAKPRSVREIVDVFGQAARGLHAAHSCGIVHRDFKPDNAMVGNDGRVRVLDFGLAAIGTPPGTLTSSDASMDRSSSDAGLTRTGAVLGTPYYMAPEQLCGEGITGASDQFALCVALHEALYGKRPFEGGSLTTLRDAVLTGRRTVVAWRQRAGRRLHQVVDRGLSRDAAQRWPSMARLADALEASQRPLLSGIAPWLAVAGVAGVAVTIVMGVRASEVCEGSAEQMANAWSDDKAEAIREALASASRGRDVSTWERIHPRLQAYADSWIAAHRRSCEDTRIRETHSEALLDRRMRCLDARRRSFQALVGALGVPRDDSAVRAIDAVAALQPAETCTDEAYASTNIEPPAPVAAQAVAGLRTELARTEALMQLGAYKEALQHLEGTLARVHQVGYEPLRGEAARLEGRLRTYLGDATTGAARLEDAYRSFMLLEDDREAGIVAAWLVDAIGVRLDRYEEAHWWASQSELLLERARVSPSVRAATKEHLFGVLIEQGRFPEAREAAEAVIALRNEARAPDSGNAHLRLATVMFKQGELGPAVAEFERAGELYESEYGMDHPDLAIVHNNLAGALEALGRLEDSMRHAEIALAIRRRVFGDSHPAVTSSLGNIAILYYRQKRYDEAERAMAEHVARLKHRAAGSHDASLGTALAHWGINAAAQQRWTEAISRLEEGLTHLQKTVGERHPETAVCHDNMAFALMGTGRYEAALEHADAAVAQGIATLGETHQQVAQSLLRRAQALSHLGRAHEALQSLERAAPIVAGLPFTHELRAQVELGLAGAAIETGNPARSIEILEKLASEPDLDVTLRIDALAEAVRAYLQLDALADAEEAAERATALAGESDDALSRIEADVALGLVLLRRAPTSDRGLRLLRRAKIELRELDGHEARELGAEIDRAL